MYITHNNISKLLETLYHKYNSVNSSVDPIWNLRNVKSNLDKEILAFIISCYSYGNITQINKFIKNVLNFTGPKISDFITSFKGYQSIDKYNFVYRFNTNKDFFDLIFAISDVLKNYGSLKSLFLKHYKVDDVNVINALDSFTSEIRSIKKYNISFDYLLPDLARKSACKRLFLFLRWMVRKDNVDLGLWKNDIHTSKLIIPVDTHIYKISRKYGLITRKSLDLKFAVELTEKLKEFDPDDPVKFDFSLCHLGVDRVQL